MVHLGQRYLNVQFHAGAPGHECHIGGGDIFQIAVGYGRISPYAPSKETSPTAIAVPPTFTVHHRSRAFNHAGAVCNQRAGCDSELFKKYFPGCALQRFSSGVPVPADDHGGFLDFLRVIGFDDIDHIESPKDGEALFPGDARTIPLDFFADYDC